MSFRKKVSVKAGLQNSLVCLDERLFAGHKLTDQATRNTTLST
jgi:hypothetical protein